MADSSLAPSPVPAVEPVTPTLQQRLTSELDAAHLAKDEADNFVYFCNFALRQQDCDIDGAEADKTFERWFKQAWRGAL